MQLRKIIFTKNLCSTFCGVSLFSFGLILLIGNEWLMGVVLKSQMLIKPGTEAFEAWRKPPMDLALDMYFFNWTNPHDIYNKSTKPIFQEVGPYRYLETLEKVDIVFNANKTVSFKQKRTWHYDPKFGDRLDMVTTVNPISASAAYKARHWGYFSKRGVSLSLSALAPDIHVTKPVGEVLFEGYSDPFVSLANTFPVLADTPIPSMDKFGWFYPRNASATFDGDFNMATGEDLPIGELYQWNFQHRTPYYQGYCGAVHGSAGELYSEKRTKSFIGFFSSEICRYLKLDYQKEETVNGILGYKYTISKATFDNGSLVPENRCYCTGNCISQPSGVLNVSSCRYGTPAFLSLPHFYQADPFYTDSVEGVHPDQNKHEFQITLEPTTGIPLSVSARLQLNMYLLPVDGISIFEDVPSVLFPILWFEETVKIPDKYSFLLKVLLALPMICTGLGTLFMLTGLVILIFTTYKSISNSVDKKSVEKHQLAMDEEVVPLQIEMTPCIKVDKNRQYE